MDNLKKIITKGSKFGNVEVSLNETTETTVEYINDNLRNFVEGDSKSLSIRISKGNKFGYSTTTNTENWESCLKNAIKIMKISKPLKEKIELSEKMRLKKPDGIFFKKLEKLSNEKILLLGDKIIDTVKGMHKSLIVPEASITKVIGKSNFLNSNGVNVKEKSTLFSAASYPIIGTASGTDARVSHNVFDTKEIAVNSAQMCIDSLKPKPIATMKTELVLDYFAFSDLISSILVPSLSGQNVFNKRSYLEGKLGKKVFSDKLTVLDNGLLNKGLYSSSTDAEGTKRQITNLIEKGVVKNFLYDNYSAKLAKVSSSGNCTGMEKVPAVGPSNLIVKPGNYKKEEIIKETKKGIYAHFLAGTHAVNEITGDVSLAVSNSFYIEKGKIINPIKQAMVSFNLFEALNHLEYIGKELRQDSEVMCPIVKFENVQIIG